MPIIKFQLTVKWAKMLTPNVRHIAFVRSDGEPFPFVPGQFINLHIENADKEKRRSYSVASIVPETNEIEIACSYVDGGIATQLLSSLKEGDEVTASGPFGRLILRDDDPKRYIMIATGTGITPYRAMLPELVKRQVPTVIIQGMRTINECLYLDDFKRYCDEHTHLSHFACASREAVTGEHEREGHVQVLFEELNFSAEDDVVYLCGNPNMIDDTFNYLKELGFAPASVRREKYISNN